MLAGAAAVDPASRCLPLLLALVLFLWTPPHFWSLAIANRADYAEAGVPMLPVVVGTRAPRDRVLAARWPWWRVVCPSGSAPGWSTGGATAGGGYFIAQGLAARAAPSRKTAMACFLASLVQLSLLLRPRAPTPG